MIDPFRPSPTRLAFRELLSAECTPAAVRTAWESPNGLSPQLWRKMGEIGVFRTLLPTSLGGAAYGAIEMVGLAEDAGYFGLPDPLIEHAVVGLPVLVEAATLRNQPDLVDLDAADLIHRAAEGIAVVTTAGFDGSFYVVHGHSADAVVAFEGRWITLVENTRYLAAVDSQVVPDVVRTMDRSRRLTRAPIDGWSGTTVATGVQANRLAGEATLRGVLATAAFLVGAARRCTGFVLDRGPARVDDGDRFLRIQTFPERLRTVISELEVAHAAVLRAAEMTFDGSKDRQRYVSLAKSIASDSAQTAARASLEVIGTVGHTADHDLHLWLSRIESLAAAWGTSAKHRSLFADTIGLT